jgi:uncharacterized membrane protein
MVMRSQDTLAAPDARFSAVLLPHRSLGRKGFIMLMGVIGVASLLTGIAFYMKGAWPVMGFFGFDIVLVYGAFRLNYRAARVYETVELSDSELKVTRFHPSGRSQCWSFNPYWVRLDLVESESAANRMSLRSHGRVLSFGNFLSDDEKRGFAHALRGALYSLRGSRA